MKFFYLAKITLCLLLSIKFVSSLNSSNNEQSVIQNDPAKRGIIYWTPTTANIIDSDSSISTQPSFSNSQLVTPHSYQYYPNTTPVFPNTYQFYPASASITPTNYHYYTTPSYPYYPVSYSAPIPYGTGYYYGPGVSYYFGRKEPFFAQGPEMVSNNKTKQEKQQGLRKSGFQDVSEEIKNLKKEVFGNSNADMSFYKSNKNSFYDSKWLERAQKIAKILELEELLEFFMNHNNNKPITQNKEVKKESQKEINGQNVSSLQIQQQQGDNRVSIEVKEIKSQEVKKDNTEIVSKPQGINKKDEKANNLRKN